eukprot:CAMPEP_0174732336 /NCGR_PEP_ID=MMETSP1094-20130205/59218_1 /TAXON_ID=156173 /ORGANISM="Chrysochromulina brevifilum, Strain UTEX LB 985" /LENGTH=77 /DNA_ID=CAMNT_0015934839 /DNA_START=45 /DNA_END=278 /DNA_ORIENTATION=-
MESWAQIFKDKTGVQVKPAEVRLMRLGPLGAIVTCIERLGSSGDSNLVATNVFEREPQTGRWRMVLHQAGPVMIDTS